MSSEWSPLFQWGFSIRRSKHLVPILSNNMIVLGSDAVAGNHPQNSLLSEPPSEPLLSRRQAAMKLSHLNDQTEFRPKSAPIEANLTLNTSQTLSNSPEKADSPPLVSTVSQPQLSFTDTSKLSSSLTQELEFDPLEYADDTEIAEMVEGGKIAPYALESKFGVSRAVRIRRLVLQRSLSHNAQLDALVLPESYTSAKVGLCENFIGCVAVPVGIAGPLLVNGQTYQVPMATTEGCLVASTHRGCKAITASGGATAAIVRKGMSRGPVIRMPDLSRAVVLKQFVESEEGFEKICEAFNGQSRFARLKSIKVALAGRTIYLRFVSSTGDAMGMNMLSKGVEAALQALQEKFSDLEILSLSGNFCTDKKPSAVNWLEGRGHSVVCEAVISKENVEKILKTTVEAMVDLNISKNLIGSAMAGSIGGYNAHASNIVTAFFIATGQDVAQNVESSNCITLMERTYEGDLRVSVSMPSIEVGSVGGGTSLPGQSACLEILGAKGTGASAGDNSDTLAIVVCAAVLAGELSLMAALAAGHLVKSHMKYNRASSK